MTVRRRDPRVRRCDVGFRGPGETEGTEVMSNLIVSDGFTTDISGRVIQGVLIKCVDGHWSSKSDTDLPEKLLAIGVIDIMQRWEKQKPVDVIIAEPGKRLPDIDELNGEIPGAEWELGPDGNPKPPWQFQHIVYLVDPDTAAKYTFASGTTGARIAVDNLRDQVSTMRMLKGHVTPIVALGDAPMSTKFGMKVRPAFDVVGWTQLADMVAPARLEHVKGVTPVDPPTISEELNDEIDF
jgi:hypothetical protein